MDADVVQSLSVQHEYADWWKQNDPNGSTHVVPSVEDAVETARKVSAAAAGRSVYILATGSFRLIGGVLAVLEGEDIGSEPSTST